MRDRLPRVYCASPLGRAKMWRILDFPAIHIISTWHDSVTLATDDQDPRAAGVGWQTNFDQIETADHLLVYAELHDKPSGTFVEIGHALAYHIPIALVGSYPWGSWHYHPLLTKYETLLAAAEAIKLTHRKLMERTHEH